MGRTSFLAAACKRLIVSAYSGTKPSASLSTKGDRCGGGILLAGQSCQNKKHAAC